MEKSLQKHLKSLSGGEDGEIKLYSLFEKRNFMEQPGAIVFPNVDGSHIFKCQIAKVEIDMVLIHSKKGIFVFNVKNQGGKGTSEREVKENIKKHSNFVHMLKNYKSTEDNCITPIHTVICDFANEKTKFTKLETRNENTGEHIIVFDKKDLETANFIKTWISRIEKISDVVWNTSLDVLVARMIALASIEGATSLIHEQMATGLLQSTNEKEYLEWQMGSFGNNPNGKETVAQHSKIENRKGKKRFILWTKAQMAVIAEVYKHVTTSQDCGLRLLVTGGRGTGKTMLLVFLAKMVQSIIEIQTGERTSRTVVTEGTVTSHGLIQVLKRALCYSNVQVYDFSGEIHKYFLLKDPDRKLHFIQKNVKSLIKIDLNEYYLKLKSKAIAWKPAVTWNFWASVLCNLAAEDVCFRMRITLGVVLISSLVFHICVPEWSRNDSGMRPYLLIQEKFVYFGQSAQKAGFCLAELLGQFFSDSAFNLLKNCVIYSPLTLGTDVFCDWPFLGCSSCVSLVTAAKFCLFLNVAIILKEKMLRSYED